MTSCGEMILFKAPLINQYNPSKCITVNAAQHIFHYESSHSITKVLQEMVEFCTQILKYDLETLPLSSMKQCFCFFITNVIKHKT